MNETVHLAVHFLLTDVVVFVDLGVVYNKKKPITLSSQLPEKYFSLLFCYLSCRHMMRALVTIMIHATTFAMHGTSLH
jgi:hypothetical protein